LIDGGRERRGGGREGRAYERLLGIDVGFAGAGFNC